MAIHLNDNINILAPKPTDARYLNIMTPYVDVVEVCSLIPQPQRYIGLTVNVSGNEYWFKNGILDTNLIPKDVNEIDFSNLIIGVSNLGSFNGFDGVQILNLSTSVGNSKYNGYYNSTYQSYYIDEDGYARMGIKPWGSGVSRRGYVRPATIALPNQTSFVWNYSTSNGRKVGWIFVDGNIEELLNTIVDTDIYYDIDTEPCVDDLVDGYTKIINVGSVSSFFISVTGDLDSGNPLQIGVPIFSKIEDNIVGLKSIHSLSDDLNVWNDDDRIYFDIDIPITGVTSPAGSGISLINGITNKEIVFKKIIGDGNTIHVETYGKNQIRIFSSGEGGGDGGGNRILFEKNNESWNEEEIELNIPEDSGGVRITYSIIRGIERRMGEIYFTTKENSEIFVSSMFDNIENILFIKEIDDGVVFKIKNDASNNVNDSIKINLLINYI